MPNAQQVAAVYEVACALLGASMGAVSTFTSGNAQPVAEYGVSKAVKGVCGLAPGGPKVFEVSYDAAKIATHAVRAQFIRDNLDPANIEGAMKCLNIDKSHYEQWRFFQSASDLRSDILSSFKKDKLFKLGFELQTASGPVFFSMSQISRDFMEVQTGAKEGLTRHALMRALMYYVPQPVQPKTEPAVQVTPVFNNASF